MENKVKFEQVTINGRQKRNGTVTRYKVLVNVSSTEETFELFVGTVERKGKRRWLLREAVTGRMVHEATGSGVVADSEAETRAAGAEKLVELANKSLIDMYFDHEVTAA